MRGALLTLCMVGLLGTSVMAADEGEKGCCKRTKARVSRTANRGKLRCSLTGTDVESCCCVRRNGKLYCTLAKQNVDSCCCEPASGVSATTGEAPKEEESGRSHR